MKGKRNSLAGLLFSGISTSSARDFGVLVAIVMLVVYLMWNVKKMPVYAITVLLLSLTLPAVFKPFAKGWLSGSRFLAAGVSNVLLLVVFYVILTPLGLLVRSFRRDPLRLHQFKKGGGSVFADRRHTFRSRDMQNPY